MKKPGTKIPSVQGKFDLTRQVLKSSLIERDEEIDLILTALICGEHPLLVGPPGTAKSMLLDTLMRWLSANKFEILIGKFSTPEELFGPISVQGLKNDEYRRITTGMLPEASGAFIDEIFKASTAILNTLLRLLNERVYCNGDGEFRKVPLQICVAASNEWPNDQEGGKELGALFDRFLFRKTVRPIATKEGRRKLFWEEDLTPDIPTRISVEEIEEARESADSLDFEDDAKEAYELIVDTLNQEGIFPGDRRLRKGVGACRAYAYLCGSDDIVSREHLEILSHVLWDDPTEQPEKCAKVVMKIANPTGALINEKLAQVQDVLAKSTPTEAVPKLQEIQKELQALPEHDRKKQAVRYLGQIIKDTYNSVIGVSE